jgi:GntR family transcriptional regulator, transcriptional repressor for pyruvate dehydrogenase complex
MLREIPKLSLSDRAFDQLAHEIMSGTYKPGTHLPAERALVQLLNVNRQVIREALKRLEQIGLVKVAQGAGTTVVDFKRNAGLALVDLLVENAQASEVGLWHAGLEMRVAIGADCARLCAMRGATDLKRKLLEIADKMLEVADGPDLFRLELQFWDRVVDGAANLFYRLAHNTLIKAFLAPASVDVATQWAIHEVKNSGYRVPLAKAIAAGNAQAAESKARESMRLLLEFFPEQSVALPRPPARSSAGTARGKQAPTRKSQKRRRQ